MGLFLRLREKMAKVAATLGVVTLYTGWLRRVDINFKHRRTEEVLASSVGNTSRK